MLKVRWYEKCHACPACANEWTDEWTCICNDRCPNCDVESSPVSWEDMSRPLTPEDYEGADRRARSQFANTPGRRDHAITPEEARDYAEARLEGR